MTNSHTEYGFHVQVSANDFPSVAELVRKFQLLTAEVRRMGLAPEHWAVDPSALDEKHQKLVMAAWRGVLRRHEWARHRAAYDRLTRKLCDTRHRLKGRRG